jgi:hypothetical protein
LANTQEIEIRKIDNVWHIRDYGRGLNYHHLTENEDQEKLIGRFGVGLKDSLATLYRNNIVVNITSKYGYITLKQSHKNGFNDIVTVHANITEAIDKEMVGTDFSLNGCTGQDITAAQSLFLKFDNAKTLEQTLYGEVIEKKVILRIYT